MSDDWQNQKSEIQFCDMQRIIADAEKEKKALREKNHSGCLKSFVILIGLFVVAVYVGSQLWTGGTSDSGSSTRTKTNSGSSTRTKKWDLEFDNARPTVGSSSRTKKWYVGGSLHNKSALEWQAASRANKLATCADFVTTMWQNGNLKPSIANNISTVDDVRPYAQELVVFLDAAFKPDPNPEQNRKLFTNQTVSGAAAIGMVAMGWTK